MKKIITIIRKELIDTLRDRKTLISAVLIPALAAPLLILGVTKLTKSLTEKERTKQLKIAMFNAPPAVEQHFSDSSIRIIRGSTLAAARDSVEAEKFDAVLDFDPAFAADIDSMQTGALRFYYKSTNTMVESRVTGKLDKYKADVLASRFQRLRLPADMLNPLAVQHMDVASTKEQLGLLVGGFIPYFFIIFCFLGCVYPTLDLITGEKEKGTIETLLTVPTSRLHILLGKMITISIVGICAAVMTMAGMFAVIRLSNEIPPDILATINDILSIRFIIMLFAMLIPLSFFFSGVLSAIAIRASSFKEAQSYVTPLNFVVIVPAMLALIPGMKLSWQTVWIPILNIALATKEIVAGTINNLHYIAIVVSLVALALLAALASYRQFSNEKNILK
jgi:sodium transport system permease protein